MATAAVSLEWAAIEAAIDDGLKYQKPLEVCLQDILLRDCFPGMLFAVTEVK